MGFAEFTKTLLSFYSLSTDVTKEPPVCPACSLELEARAVQESRIHVCPKCTGVWLDEDTFGTLLEEPRESLEFLLVEATPEHTFDRSPRSRDCPSCDKLMDNYQFAYDSGIWLDACPSRHGIWLDGGELKLCWDCKHSQACPLQLLGGATTERGDLQDIHGEIEKEWSARTV